MGIISAVVALATKAVSVVVSVAKTVGPTVVKFVKELIPKLPDIEENLKIISRIITMVANILGLGKKDETTEELGLKAAKSDKKLEDFKSVKEYIEHLRNDIQLSREDLKKLSLEERLGYSAIGVALYSKAIEENERVGIPPNFWVEVARQNMNPEEAIAYIKAFREGGMRNVTLGDYLKANKDNPLTVEEKEKIKDILTDIYRSLEPNLSSEDLEAKITAMKAKAREKAD